MPENCPVCESPLNERPRKSSGWDSYSCPVCGEFSLYEMAVTFLPNKLKDEPVKRAILSHAIRKMQSGGKTPRLGPNRVNHILENEQLPTPKEQADNLIRWLGENVRGLGDFCEVGDKALQAIMGARTTAEAKRIVKHLSDRGFLDIENIGYGLSFDGWERYEELERSISDSRKVFMAMKFGDEKLDKFAKECVKPAVEQTGFNLVRVDWEPQAGPIDNRIRVEIRTSRFLVADLTHNNLGAYWEAGFAEGLGKPVFYTCEKGCFDSKGTHFDVRQHYTVVWEEGKFEEAAEKLKTEIQNTLPTEAKMD